ncbi:MAG: branched-chain amino acid ABC transporter permease [Candidatus Rokuibacteriota bacterium]
MRTRAILVAMIAALAGLLAVGATIEEGPNPFIVLGLVNGALYGLMALGLVLVYKGARVFNFMHGELGTLAAYLLVFAVDDRQFAAGLGLPYGVGIVFAVVATVMVGLFLERIVIRPLLDAPRITVLVSTIAMALALIGIEIAVFSTDPRTMPAVIEAVDAQGNPRGMVVAAVQVSPQQLIAVGVLLLVAALLAYFFSRTDLGLAVLATSQDSFATRVVGVGVQRMSMFIWGSAAFLAAVAAILYVPTTGSLQPAVMTTNILIPAFTGAVIGGMTSLPGAFAGGATVGVVQTVAQWAANHFTLADGRSYSEVVPGSEQIVLFLVLLVILLVRPRGLLGREA